MPIPEITAHGWPVATTDPGRQHALQRHARALLRRAGLGPAIATTSLEISTTVCFSPLFLLFRYC
ncbi:hypothetical protein FNV43_RR07496 [Rhamnella rubrinervis]|uniref:Uncharacterized protein n=1 Tax=Rhamnella rubrinervis TaxID=2594499 RepID=A0A8K0MM90_9ROSA|nr:hypothetical protein FNV43_RR07496 [Rhamnella rubrinervis]